MNIDTENIKRQCLATYEKVRVQFTEHPRETKDTWYTHCYYTASYGLTALTAGCSLLVHSVFPCWFQNWGNQHILDLGEKIKVSKKPPLVKKIE